MKKTLILGISTAIIITSLTSCGFTPLAYGPPTPPDPTPFENWGNNLPDVPIENNINNE